MEQQTDQELQRTSMENRKYKNRMVEGNVKQVSSSRTESVSETTDGREQLTTNQQDSDVHAHTDVTSKRENLFLLQLD